MTHTTTHECMPDHAACTKHERKVVAAAADAPEVFVHTRFGRRRAPGALKRFGLGLTSPFRWGAKILRDDRDCPALPAPAKPS